MTRHQSALNCFTAASASALPGISRKREIITWLLIPAIVGFTPLLANPAVNAAPPVAEAPSPELRRLIRGEATLLGYWPLAGNLKPEAGALQLRSGTDKTVFRAGPSAGDHAIDLSNGAYLSIAPTAVLDSPELTVEMIFMPKYSASGALFGIRNGGATRFSLHHTAESPVLQFWNGTVVTKFEADTPIKMGEWHHLALAVSGTESVLWINGKRCTASGKTGMATGSAGLPFLVGTTDYLTGKAERAEIQLSHLAIHQSMLGDDAVVARLKSLGWTEKLQPVPPQVIADEIARIDERISGIKANHGVNVRHLYSHKEFIPEVWHGVGEGSQLPMELVPMALDEIEAFLAVVPATLSRKELDNIFLFDRLRINGGGMGGMAYGKSIYLCCVRPRIEIRYSLYHELGHILQVAYPIADEAWATLLPKDYKYGQSTNANPFGFDGRLRADGFIINYSTTNRHEDICVMSDYIFARQHETMDMMAAFPAIKRKVAAVVKYYEAIDPGYDLGCYQEIIRDVDAPDILKSPVEAAGADMPSGAQPVVVAIAVHHQHPDQRPFRTGQSRNQGQREAGKPAVYWDHGG